MRGVVIPAAASTAAAFSPTTTSIALSPVTAVSLSAVSAVSLSPIPAVPIVDLVPVEVVVVVDVDLVVAPAAAAPHAAPEGSHRQADSERDERGTHRVVGVVDRRVRVNRRAVDDDRVIGRD